MFAFCFFCCCSFIFFASSLMHLYNGCRLSEPGVSLGGMNWTLRVNSPRGQTRPCEDKMTFCHSVGHQQAWGALSWLPSGSLFLALPLCFPQKERQVRIEVERLDSGTRWLALESLTLTSGHLLSPLYKAGLVIVPTPWGCYEDELNLCVKSLEPSLARRRCHTWASYCYIRLNCITFLLFLGWKWSSIGNFIWLPHCDSTLCLRLSARLESIISMGVSVCFCLTWWLPWARSRSASLLLGSV